MALIPVTLATHNGKTIQAVGEPVCDGLVITPATRQASANDADAMFVGLWTITHLPSGRTYLPVSACIYCIRRIARIAAKSGIDWSRDEVALTTDAAARRLVTDAYGIAMHCPASDCEEYR